MLKLYTNPHITREPRSNKVPPEEFAQDVEGYRAELQYSQLQPRNIDPDTLVRKSEGELMRTFGAKSLLGASLDQLAIDQLRLEEGEENARRMRVVATDLHFTRSSLLHAALLTIVATPLPAHPDTGGELETSPLIELLKSYFWL